VEVCAERDVKGLYKKAMAGEIKQFTGVSDPYEEPINPEVVCQTDQETVEESTEKVLRKMELLGYLPPLGDIEYPPEEEAKIKERLSSLGYF
jgi:adenylylsulfate kinase